MRYILILFIPMFSLEGFSQTDYLRPHYQDYDATHSRYNDIHEFSADLVTSDFGPRRIPYYDWHSGIDFTCGSCQNNLAIACQEGYFYYGVATGNLRYVIIDGTSNLAYLHLFSSLDAGNCHILDMKGKPWIKVVLIKYNGTTLAFAEETGTVTYQGVNYQVTDYINAGQPLGAIGGSGGYAVHLHIEELPDGVRNIANDNVSKNPLQTLDYDQPVYSQIGLYYSITNNIHNVTEGINIKYPGTKSNSILIRPTFPNGISNGHRFSTINDVDKIQLNYRNISMNGQWSLISGPNYLSEFKYGGLLGQTAYPNKILGSEFGSFAITGIYPDAYADSQSKEYDNFIYCDFFHRIHKSDGMKGNKSILFSNCPDDSRYPDGNYEFKSKLINITGDATDGNTYNATIDNFQPYIKSVSVLIDGINIYSASWDCTNDGPKFSGYECRTTDISPNSIITVNANTSEPLSFLNGKILEFPGNFISFNYLGGLNWTVSFQNMNYLKDGDKGHLQFAGIDLNGNHLLDMKAMAGGKVSSKLAVKIPIRESATTWKPTRKGGDYDNVHEFCFKKCHEFRNEESRNEFLSPDCITSEDLNLTYEVESFNGAGDGWARLEISGGAPPYFIQWSDLSGNIIKQGLNEFDLTNLVAGTYCYSIQDEHCCQIKNCITLCPSIEVSVTYGITNPSDCQINDGNIGIINAKATGGQNPYDFHLEDIYGNRITQDPNTGNYEELFSGMYYYIATDENGCTGSFAIELKSPGDFYIQSIVTNSCNGNDGVIDVNAFSQDYPDDIYQFNWSNGFEEKDVEESRIDHLISGKYCVTITSNTTQCSQADCFEVKGSGKPLVLKYSTRIPCPNQKNGEIHLTVTGGSKPYSYQWANGDFRSNLTNLAAGEYCVIVTDACYNSIEECINISNVLSLDLNMEFKCPDKVNVFSAPTGGNPPFTYKWSNGAITKDLIGVPIDIIYKLTVSDKYGCTDVKDINTNPIELINPVKPCKGFWDGEMTIKINNPKNDKVDVEYDYTPCDDCVPFYKIHDDYSNPIQFTLKDLAGNKQYHFYVRIGNCVFEIKFTLGEEGLQEEFKRYEESNGVAACVYDLVCKDNRIVDGKREDPILTHTGGNCQKFLFKKCASVEVRCPGNSGIVKTIPGKVVHMRRLEVIRYAQQLGFDPSSLSGGFCDHMWICQDDPFCIIAQAKGELGGKFKGIEQEGDCYRVKCRSFFGLINQDYKICGEDFIPEAFLPFYRNDRIFDEPGSKPKPRDCTPVTLNFTDVLDCWSKFVMEQGNKFYESDMAKLVDSYRNRRERYCAWVTFCLEDFSIIKSNINDFECEDFNPPINVGQWLVYSTCEPHSYKGNDIVFCECNDPEIILKYGKCLEPRLLPQKCTITLKNTDEPKEIQFLPLQNGNTFFTNFSTFYQPEGFTTLNGIFRDENGNSLYQKYEPGEIYNSLASFDGAVFAHQNAKNDRINLITKGNLANEFEIYFGDFNEIEFNSISSDRYLNFISFFPYENGFIAVGEFSGHLSLGTEIMGSTLSTNLFILYRNDHSKQTKITILSGASLLNRNSRNSNCFLLKRNSTQEAILLNGNNIELNSSENTLQLKVDLNGEIGINAFLDISNNLKILSFRASKDGMNRYILGSAKGTLLFGDVSIHLPDQDQIILMKWRENNLEWYKNFAQSGIDTQYIGMENKNDQGVVLGLNVSSMSNLFKTDLNYLNSIGSDIVILNYDGDGNEIFNKRYGSVSDDDVLKDLYYSEENVLYLGGEIKGPSSIRSIGDLDLIKSGNIDHSAFISYINFNANAINTNLRNQDNEQLSRNRITIISLTPNPVGNQLTIEFEYDGVNKVIPEIYDLNGKLINITAYIERKNIIINMQQLTAGLYIIKLKDEFGNFDVKRFIKL